MEVDEWAESQVPVIVCSGLEREEGVDVDGAEAEALLCRVVRVDKGVGADGILLEAAVAGPVGGQPKTNANRWLECPIVCRACDEVGKVAEESLKRE